MAVLPERQRLVGHLGDVLLLDLDSQPRQIGHVDVPVLNLPFVLHEAVELIPIAGLLDQEIVHYRIGGQGGAIVERPASDVGSHQHLVLLGRLGDLQQRGDPESVQGVGLQHGTGPLVDNGFEVVQGKELLSGGNGHRTVPGNRQQGLDRAHLDGFFQEEGLVGGHPAGIVDAEFRGGASVGVQKDIEVGPHGAAHGLHAGHAVGHGGLVHGPGPGLQGIALDPGKAGLGHPLGLLDSRLGAVEQGAPGVNPDLVASSASQDGMDGHPPGLARDIVQCDVDGRDGRAEGGPALPGEPVLDILRQPDHAQRVLSDQQRLPLVQGGLHRRHQPLPAAFTPAHNAGIGGDLQEQPGLGRA